MLRSDPRLLRLSSAASYVGVLCQSRLTLCDPMDCSPAGPSVRGIFQARILEWFAISYFRGSSQYRDWTQVSRVSCSGQADSLPLAPPAKPPYLLYLDSKLLSPSNWVIIHRHRESWGWEGWLSSFQHAWFPCPSPAPRTCSNSCPSSCWCHPTLYFNPFLIPFSRSTKVLILFEVY